MNGYLNEISQITKYGLKNSVSLTMEARKRKDDVLIELGGAYDQRKTLPNTNCKSQFIYLNQINLVDFVYAKLH